MAKKRLLKKYDGKKYDWWNFWKLVLALCVVIFIAFRFFIGISVVDGDSMLPTYEDGDRVVYSRLAKDFKQGDVVSVRVPSGDYYIKRVIAVGGDQVNIANDKLYLNKEKFEEDYIQGTTSPQEGSVKYPYAVNEDFVFVMGDNRDVSMDSRTFGAVNVTQIKGKVIFSF